MLLLHGKYTSHQVTILHISQQLSCCDMCKIVTWLDHWNCDLSIINFDEIWMMISSEVCEKGPMMPWSLHVRQGWTLVWLDYPNHDHPVAWGSRGSAAGIIRWIMDEIICRSCIPGYLSMSVHAVSLSMDMHSALIACRILFQYKDHLSRHGDSHYKDDAMVRPSYLYDGNLYAVLPVQG